MDYEFLKKKNPKLTFEQDVERWLKWKRVDKEMVLKVTFERGTFKVKIKNILKYVYEDLTEARKKQIKLQIINAETQGNTRVFSLFGLIAKEGLIRGRLKTE